MLKFKRNKITYEVNGKEEDIIWNTTEEKFHAFEVHLKKIYGEIPNLVTIKHEVIYFF